MTNLSANPIRELHSAFECQQTCQQTGGCRYFSWDPGASACWLADYTMNKFEKQAHFIGGLRECGGLSPLCTALPGDGFPGQTAAESDEAWSTGLVPPKLQCWPRDKDDGLVPCAKEVTVLDDASKGWPGKCTGLEEASEPQNASACQESCSKQLGCNTWQQTQGQNSHCWLGKAEDCLQQRQVNVTASQRLMRGSFRVLLDLKGWEVAQLKQAFPAGGGDLDLSTEDAIQQCNHTCLAVIECEVWQYSTETGCLVNDPAFLELTYPPTSSSFMADTPAGRSVVAGAYIQRLCLSESGSGGDAPSPTPSPPPPPPAAPLATAKATPAALTTAKAVPATELGKPKSETVTFTSVTATTVSQTTPFSTTATSHTGSTISTGSDTTTTSTTTTSSTVTTTTPLQPVVPRKGLQDMFIKGDDNMEVYFRDGESATKHLVRLGACIRCNYTVQEQCANPKRVPEGEVIGLPTGEDFECSMYAQGGEVKPLSSQMEVLSKEGKMPSAMTVAPDTTTTTTATTSTGTTKLLGVAEKPEPGPSTPWWVWMLGALVVACCAGFFLFAYLSVQKAKAAEKRSKRAAAVKASKLEDGTHFSEESTDDVRHMSSDLSSLQAEASEPLMGQLHGPAAVPLMSAAPAPQLPPAGQPPQYNFGATAGRAEERGTPPCPMGPTAPWMGGMGACTPAPTPPAPFGRGPAAPDMDLVMVTPQGLAVTPLHGTPPPAGVPLLQDIQVPATHGRGGVPQPQQDMDLVTVTPQGLAVTSLNGNPPPAGVPYLGVA